MLDIDATKANLANFIADRERSRAYFGKRHNVDPDEKKFPIVGVIISSFLILSCIAIPAGLVVLYIVFKKRETLRETTLKKISQQDLVLTYVVVGNTNISDPNTLASLLTLGSFDEPTPELEELCKELTGKPQHLFMTKSSEVPDDQELLEFLMRLPRSGFSSRRLPKAYTGEYTLYAFNILADQECLNSSTSPMEVAALGFEFVGGVTSIPSACVVRRN